MSQPLLLASRNPHKLAELRRILAAANLPFELVGLDEVPPYDEVPGTGATFEENALAKAQEATRNTGLPAVADDSGLAVDALNGMPGVLSARWSGTRDDEANRQLVLAQLVDVPDERRGAAFVCAAAVALPTGEHRVVTASLTGTVLRAPRGSGGFGYDPLFLPTGHARTTAEMTAADKDEISHRGRALRALAPLLPELLGLAELRGPAELLAPAELLGPGRVGAEEGTRTPTPEGTSS